MSMIKRATFEVMAASIGTIPAPVQAVGMTRVAHRWTPKYQPREGYLYVRSRAISSRTNDNFDNFPPEEITAAWRTFVGKPIFVNHHNANHRRARGVIIDAALHEDITPDGKPDTWVEVLMEVDAIRFPMLAKAVIEKKITTTSMGTSVGLSVCSYCGNEAEDAAQFCKHIPAMKGQRITRTREDGTREAVLVYEICRKLAFFEDSLLMEEPADPTAVLTGVDTSGIEAEPVTAGLLTAASKSPKVMPFLPKTAAGRRFRVREMYGQHIVWDTLEDHSVQAWPTRNAAQKQARGLNDEHEDRLAHPDEYSGKTSSRRGTMTTTTASTTSLIPAYEFHRWHIGTTHALWVQDDWDLEDVRGDGALCGAHEVQGEWHFKDDSELDLTDVNCQGCLAAMASRTAALPGVREIGASKTASGGDSRYSSDGAVMRRYRDESPQGESLVVVEAFKGFRDEGQETPEELGYFKVEAATGQVYDSHLESEARWYPDLMSDMESWARDGLSHTASRHTALGETRAPRQVDTLRDDACPVCSNTSYDGEACNQCGYIKPPLIFQDPNVEADDELDRPEVEPVDLACDDCGAVFPVEEETRTAASKPWESDGEDPDDEDEPEDERPWEPDGPEAPRSVEHPTGLPDEPLPGAGGPNPERKPKQGDLCPKCGVGTLVDKSELDGIEQADVAEDEPQQDDDPDFEPDDGLDETSEDEPQGQPKEESRQAMSTSTRQGGQQRRRQASQQGQPTNQPGQARRNIFATLRDMQRAQEQTNDRLNRVAGQNVALREALKESNARLRDTALALADVAAGARTERVANLLSMAGLKARADAANPANKDALDVKVEDVSVEAEGDVGGSANDHLAPDATTVVTEQTTVMEDSAAVGDNLVDVESLSPESAPAQGADARVPARDGGQAPKNTQTSDGDLQWKSSSMRAAQRRLMASLRLARLRIEAGVATEEEGTNDLVLSERIAASDRTTEAIEADLNVLADVVRTRQAQAHQHQRAASRSTVPRPAQGSPQTPSLATGSRTASTSSTDAVPADVQSQVDDSFI